MNAKIGLFAILASLLLGGCSFGPGVAKAIAITDEDGNPGTLVAHNQIVPDYMVSTDKLALNYMVHGEVTQKQLDAVAETERACRIYTKTVRPNALVAVITSGAIYAIAGYAGVGIGSKAFGSVTSRQYARYGGWAGLTGGLANGAISLAGKTYTFENCGERAIATFFPSSEVTITQKSPY